MDKALQQMKEASPEEKQDMAGMAVELINLSIQLLRENSEFRRAFGRVHTEFLKYPESGETLMQAITAYKEFFTDAGFSGDNTKTH